MTAVLNTSRLGSLGSAKKYTSASQYQPYQPPQSSVNLSDPNAAGEDVAAGGTSNQGWGNSWNSFMTSLGLAGLLSEGSAPATPTVIGAASGATATESPVLGMSLAPAAESGAGAGIGSSIAAAAPYAAVPLGAMALYNDFRLLNEDFASGQKSNEGKAVDVGTSYVDVVFPGLGTIIRTGLNALGVGTGGGNPREASRNAWRRSLEEKLGMRGFGDREALDPGKNPLDAEAIALADPIAEILAQGNTQNREDAADVIARQLTMGARTSYDMKNNLLTMVNKLGLTPQQVRQGLNQSYRAGNITRDRAMAYANNMASLTGRAPEREFNYIIGARNG